MANLGLGFCLPESALKRGVNAELDWKSSGKEV